MDLIWRRGNVAEAINVAGEIVRRLEALLELDPHRLATVYRRQATIYWAGGDYGAKAEDLQRSAEIFRAAGDSHAVVHRQAWGRVGGY